MSVRDLIPFGRERSQLPNLFRDDERIPFLSLHRGSIVYSTMSFVASTEDCRL